jgi:lipoprotein-anchoring transpeptidase ErfK/SrfK
MVDLERFGERAQVSPRAGFVALAVALALAFGPWATGAFAVQPVTPSLPEAPRLALAYPAEPGVPGQPVWVSPAPGKTKLVSPVAVKVTAGASTATLTLSVNGAVVRSISCAPGTTVNLGAARLGKGANTVTVTATSDTGASSSATRTLTRTEWPYATCIVVDKSDYRLYWVKNQQLVASYPIAHGRNNWTPTRTWRVLAKYKTDPHSVYGPRKMRLFKRVGSPGHYRYVYTRYLIHGTNQPSSIGHQASHGCIRMYSKDVLKLWPQVPVGTYVVTRR